MTALGRFILRAEISTAKKTVVTYAFDLTPTSVFVVTDLLAPAGSPVELKLSFPRLVPPIVVSARVSDTRAPGAPGELGGLRLELDPDSQASSTIRELLARLSTPTVPPSDAHAYRVLLVEDNKLIREVFAHGLHNFFKQKPNAFVVEHADSAEQAWTLLTDKPFDLMIVDYFLPAANGASLISRVRTDSRLADLPVVAISVGGHDAREASITAGADLFVDKPLVFRDLFSTLRILWEQHMTPNKKSILVLDDSPLALDITRTALEGAGFDVTVAADLSTFEERLATTEPDLILVDVQMPEAYGDDVAGMLVGLRGAKVPVVLLSSIEETELARRAADAQVGGYIWKGAGTKELVRRCKELLGAQA